MAEYTWPMNFPKVATFTNVRKVQEHPDFKLAKTGTISPFTGYCSYADNLVNDLIGKKSDIYLPLRDAPLLYVESGEEPRNELPSALANGLHERLESPGLVHPAHASEKCGRAGADAAWRMGHRPKFDIRNAWENAILVDDVCTMGTTLAELRAAVIKADGSVAGCICLAASMFSHQIALTAKTQHELTESYGAQRLERWCNEHGWYDGRWQAMTEAEARWLIRQGALLKASQKIANAI